MNLYLEKPYLKESAGRPYQILSSSALKMVAVVTMFIDHFGYAVAYWSESLRPYYQLCRDIGRAAFPIYCFLLVEGFLHTRSRTRYAVGLLIFGILSEIPFNLLIGARVAWAENQNVFFTLLFGFLAIWAMDRLWGKWPLVVLALAAGMAAGYVFRTDYDFKGVLLIAVFYVFRNRPWERFIVGALCLLWEWKAIFAWVSISLYNGERGWIKGPVAKYMFYVFYPAHLLLLVYLRWRLFNI